MRLFKRHFSDSSPRLVSLSPLCDQVNENSEEIRVPEQQNLASTTSAQTAQKSYKNGLSTWSKKVGRKWDQLKRSDSTEFLSISAGRTGQWSPSPFNIASSSETSLGGTAQRIRKRISRVESLRNLFLKHDRSTSASENGDRFSTSDPKESSKFSPFSTRNLNKKRNSQINDNINLSEKQLVDYLLLCQPSDRHRIVRELIETISSNDDATSNSRKSHQSLSSPFRSSTYKKNFKSVKNFFKRSLSEGSIASNTALSSMLSNQNLTSMDELCSVLNKILIDSEDDFMRSSDTLESQPGSIGDEMIEMRRSNSSGSFSSHNYDLKSEYASIPERLVGAEDDTDSCDEEFFKSNLLQSQGSLKRLRKSSNSVESIHKRQIVNYSFKSDAEQVCYIDKEFKCIRITANEAQSIVFTCQKSNPHSSCSEFVITSILPNCEAEKYGKICVGDQIVKINGQRLRGLSMQDVETLIRQSTGYIEIVLSRVPKTCVKSLPNETIPENHQFKVPRAKIDENPSATTSSSTPNGGIKRNKTRQSMLPQNSHVENSNSTLPPTTGMKKFLTPRRRSIAVEQPSKVNRRSCGGSVIGRPKSICSELKVKFEKGPGRKSLGFSVVGGCDSPRGNIGIYVKTVFARGQASDEGTLQAGDEIISVNGIVLQGLTHAEAINVFKNIKSGEVILEILRRDSTHHYQ
ncbi:uncharacterized protein LOC123302117 [Chrysoperla carnea]|uniref:uncharacterized protein LOC123302117 n=1 Tax=Chrysoperla carnea TaxID=189513 RepID=UPI001D05DE8D|nr:uncharacterized protein LOC123302117 [Chrysoperla carnea]